MSHARVEEVSDSELDSDPSEGDISDLDDTPFNEREIIKQRSAPPPQPRPAAAQPSLINPTQIPTGFQHQNSKDAQRFKKAQCIYPIYFDKRRSRKDGRMVGLEMAVENPLARDIVEACSLLRLETLFETNKIHPKDWANPGRVKVKVRGNNANVKNKHQLYTLISKHLQAHPTTEQSALRMMIPGFPMPDSSKPYPKPAVPKGKQWKMGTILPYISPALTGGGVSENFLGEIMKEMQAGGGKLPPGMPDMSGLMGGGAGPSAAAIERSKKKDKKDKKKK
ncbi:signal recognition particle, SRP19 subunit [Calycina marina]|uniref:Signal recognition particle, SRP19 subunit n=1 Tax=Calycina marina TaxID=1763456 RepID=A0A9P8CAV3_9HELO|nr:signal recognition particle, SRP19 subunit [Calycina marina]